MGTGWVTATAIAGFISPNPRPTRWLASQAHSLAPGGSSSRIQVACSSLYSTAISRPDYKLSWVFGWTNTRGRGMASPRLRGQLVAAIAHRWALCARRRAAPKQRRIESSAARRLYGAFAPRRREAAKERRIESSAAKRLYGAFAPGGAKRRRSGVDLSGVVETHHRPHVPQGLLRQLLSLFGPVRHDIADQRRVFEVARRALAYGF
jgi:hypothetical protein